MADTIPVVLPRWIAVSLVVVGCEGTALNGGTGPALDPRPVTAARQGERRFTENFRLEGCHFRTVGHNPFFPLDPGRTLILEGDIDGQPARLERTVLAETVKIAGVTTRVVEERHTEGGELVEVSRNYFAVCEPSGNVFYFGENVDNYVDGEIVDHAGSWRAGVDGARVGLIMPGVRLLGARYFQENAPDVALDRAEIIDVGAEEETPYRRFRHVLVTEESSPLEPDVVESKSYAPGVGLIVDATLRLVAVRGKGHDRDGTDDH